MPPIAPVLDLLRRGACSLLLLAAAHVSAAPATLAGDHAGEARLTAPEGKKLRVSWSAPVTIAVAAKPEKWGFFQFPNIVAARDGSLIARWALNPDAVESYGNAKAGWAVSRDGGKTWQPLADEPLDYCDGIWLPDGDAISVHTPKPTKTSDITLPAPAGTTVENYSKVTRAFYRMDEVPSQLRGVYINRLKRAAKAWTIEQATLDDPGALRYTLSGLMPIVWWGDMRLAADGSVVAGMYPGYYLRSDGTVDPMMGMSFYRTRDGGRSWKNVGRLPYSFDEKADPVGAKRMGFTEPAFEILADGSYLCVLRSTDGAGIGPMYASRSTDAGATWSQPAAIARNGVLPRLVQLKNGVVALSAGRPGVQVRFATDGRGLKWSEPVDLLPYKDDRDQVSCGYTGVLVRGPDTFLVIYSDFRHPNAQGEPRKAIKVREFTVRAE